MIEVGTKIEIEILITDKYSAESTSHPGIKECSKKRCVKNL
jgi:hypothetical protein